MVRALVILNPVAGNAHPERTRETLSRRFETHFQFELYETTGKEDLPALVQEHLQDGVEIFVAVGGDGTVGSVAAALVGSDARLGIIPTGTGNIIAHDVGIPESMDEALDLILDETNIIHLDALQIDETYALLNVSIGLSVGILRDADASRKQELGRLAYVWSGLKNLAAVDVHDVHVTVDGDLHVFRASEVLVANCPSLGMPELHVANDIRPDDGRIEVVTFRTRHIGDYWRVVLDLLFQRSRKRRHIRVMEAFSEVAIEPEFPMDVQADGDLIGTTPVVVRLVPAAVALIAPHDHAQKRSQE